MTRQEKEDLLREAVEILIKLDNHVMTSRDNAEFSQWVEDLIEQPKIGHWIEDADKWGDQVTTVNGYKCSECGEFNGYNDNFCPNCGAKMT